MYREVITECRDFYDKYFNMTKADSVLLQKNWAGVSFESSNSSVIKTAIFLLMLPPRCCIG